MGGGSGAASKHRRQHECRPHASSIQWQQKAATSSAKCSLLHAPTPGSHGTAHSLPSLQVKPPPGERPLGEPPQVKPPSCELALRLLFRHLTLHACIPFPAAASLPFTALPCTSLDCSASSPPLLPPLLPLPLPLPLFLPLQLPLPFPFPPAAHSAMLQCCSATLVQRWEGRGAALHSAGAGRESTGLGCLKQGEPLFPPVAPLLFLPVCLACTSPFPSAYLSLLHLTFPPHSPLRPSPNSPSGAEFPALPAAPLGGGRRFSGGSTAASRLTAPPPLSAVPDTYTLSIPARLFIAFALSYMFSHMLARLHLHTIFPSMLHASSPPQTKPLAAA
ncbi:unnamed protein product [Closterium sp. NIES-54]